MMKNKEKYKQTFSQVTASKVKLSEVIDMTQKDKIIFKIRYKYAVIATIICTVLLTGTVTYAAIKHFSFTDQFFENGEYIQTEYQEYPLLTVENEESRMTVESYVSSQNHKILVISVEDINDGSDAIWDYCPVVIDTNNKGISESESPAYNDSVVLHNSNWNEYKEGKTIYTFRINSESEEYLIMLPDAQHDQMKLSSMYYNYQWAVENGMEEIYYDGYLDFHNKIELVIDKTFSDKISLSLDPNVYPESRYEPTDIEISILEITVHQKCADDVTESEVNGKIPAIVINYTNGDSVCAHRGGLEYWEDSVSLWVGDEITLCSLNKGIATQTIYANQVIDIFNIKNIEVDGVVYEIK